MWSKRQEARHGNADRSRRAFSFSCCFSRSFTFATRASRRRLQSLDIGRTSIYTACLLLSGLVLWRGRVAIAIVFGGVFLVGQGMEYVRMLRSGVTMSHDLFGTTFLTLAGMHGLHVCDRAGVASGFAAVCGERDVLAVCRRVVGRDFCGGVRLEFRVINAWDWEPSVVIGCASLASAFGAHGERQRNAWYFLAGVLVLLLDLVSPLDVLGDEYLFSAHIVQHFVLAMVVPPLLIAGLPPLRLPEVSAPAGVDIGCRRDGVLAYPAPVQRRTGE